MKKNLFLVTAMVIATLASCTKESELDTTIVSATNTTSQNPITFSTYAASATATKGTAINSNSAFQKDGSFDVLTLVSDGTFYLSYDTNSNSNQYTSYIVEPDEASASAYIGLSTVEYDDDQTVNAWVNTNNMYWPNYSKMMHFAAFSPSGVIASEDVKFSQEYSNVNAVYDESDTSLITDYTFDSTYSYSFPYTVSSATISDQVDLMYAMTTVGYISPSDQVSTGGVSYVTNGEDKPNVEDAVNLHFKHALTQIAFTATKDSDLDVFVKSITICNVYNSGTFTATALTDDDDADSTTNDTVGDDLTDDNDKVNADNFGSWVVDHEGSWNSLTTRSLNADENGVYTYTPVTDTENLSGAYYTTSDSGGFSAMSNYVAPMEELTDTSHESFASIAITETTNSTSPIQLTSTTDVLMLMPQTLTAWVPTTSTELNYVGSYVNGQYADGLLSDNEYANPSMSDASRTLSYLAIDCEIYHAGMSDVAIHQGYIFVPFSTEGLDYSSARVDDAVSTTDKWLPGYKITYCLNFGGGYIVEEGHTTTIPEPGCIPDTETYTLRKISYTATIDTFVDVAASDDLGKYLD